MLGGFIIYYEYKKHINGPKVIFEILKIKLPLSMKGLPGFNMKFDDMKKLGQFYNCYCAKK